MSNRFALLLAVFLAFAPCATAAATPGDGPHGYDWAIGTWSCHNALPSAIGGPSKQTLTVARTAAGPIMYRAVAAGFDNTWYNVYVAKTKSWTSPFIVSDGSYGSESTSQTGNKIVWTGTAYDASGKATRIRDTDAVGNGKFADLGEYMSGGRWKTQYSLTCMKE